MVSWSDPHQSWRTYLKIDQIKDRRKLRFWAEVPLSPNFSKLSEKEIIMGSNFCQPFKCSEVIDLESEIIFTVPTLPRGSRLGDKC
jgi:hypothetical protein